MKSTSILFAGALLIAGGAFAQAGPTDAQIAHIVVTANQVDIDAGKLAETKGSNAQVKAFGKQMSPTTRASTSRRARWSPS